jgi:hypothetical protein
MTVRILKYLQEVSIIFPGLNSVLQIFLIFRCLLVGFSLVFKNFFIFQFVFAIFIKCVMAIPFSWFFMVFNCFAMISDSTLMLLCLGRIFKMIFLIRSIL